MQVVRPCPYIEEDQRPEVHDRKSVAEHRTIGGLGEEVVHQAQEGRSEKERHRIVAVPPLHECILTAGVDRVTLGPTRRHGQVVKDVQDCNRHHGCYIEPHRYIEMALAPNCNRSK